MSQDEWMVNLHEKRQTHFAAIGQMHGFWAGCEGTLYEILLFYCDLDHNIGRSIFAGPRVGTMIEILKRLILNKPIEKARADDLTFLLAQLAVIQNVRDKLTHHGDLGFHLVSEGGEEIGYTYIDNFDRPGRKTGEYVYTISTKQLHNCIDDLLRVVPALGRHVKPDFIPWAHSGEPDTWLCKPLSLMSHSQMIRVTPQWWQPPRPPSDAK